MSVLDSCRLMFVLGAGASVPLGMPTTKSLLEKLENKTRLGQLAAEIHRSAAYRFRIPVDSINIEDFFEHLYELQLLLWFARRSQLPTLLPGFTTAQEPVTEAADKHLAEIQLNAYRLLHRTCGDCRGAKVDALWRQIFEFVSGHQLVVPIFTLNYDWTFEKLAIENARRYQLTDGFELLGGTWDAERFAKMRPSQKKINLALFKLHGSTCWLGGMKSMGRFEARTEDDGGDGSSTRPFDIVYPGHAHEMSFGKEHWDRASDPHGMRWPWLEEDPYKTLYAHLHQATRRAKVIVVIGYAFHDKLVNQEITKASRHAKVIVVDPGIERYDKRTDSTRTDPPFEWLKYNADGTRWSRFYFLDKKFGPPDTTQMLLDAMKGLLTQQSSPRRKAVPPLALLSKRK
jgi:hypothetical protein